ncbi:MAG TPA: MFS transporter [Anaerolineae bacterium]|nr:MFS transporter [Anaerolineae bacterium]
MPHSTLPESGSATGGASRQRASIFRALRHRNFRLFFFGQMISLVGSWMQVIAQQWLVYRLTGSAAPLGTISLLGALPLIPMSLWGGSLADRLPKRTLILIAQTVMMIQAFGLAVLAYTGAVRVWHVMAMAVVLAAAQAIDLPARQAFIVEMVEGKEDLTNAIGLNSAIFNGARVVGPALAGMAVAATGEAGAFFVNGVSFVAVIAGLLMMRLPPALPAGEDSRPRTPLGSHLAEAARYVRGQQAVMVLISLVAVSAFLSMPYSTLMPVFAQKVLSASAAPLLASVCTWAQNTIGLTCQDSGALTYGLLMAATGIGAVAGALIVASMSSSARRGRWLTAGNLAFPILVILIAFSRSFSLTAALLVGVGFAFVAQNAVANTLLQISTPDKLRGRVMSFYTLTFQIAMRLGGMQAGLLGDAFGAPLAVGAGAALCLVYGLYVALRFPAVRRLA